MYSVVRLHKVVQFGSIYEVRFGTAGQVRFVQLVRFGTKWVQLVRQDTYFDCQKHS